MDMYRKLGFEVEGVSRRQYKVDDKYIDEIVMEVSDSALLFQVGN